MIALHLFFDQFISSKISEIATSLDVTSTNYDEWTVEINKITHCQLTLILFFKQGLVVSSATEKKKI